MLRFLMLIAILFAAATVVLYATDCVRRYGAAILTATLGAILALIALPFSLILGLMFATGSAGEAAYALRELHWIGPTAIIGIVLLVVSIQPVRRRAQAAE